MFKVRIPPYVAGHLKWRRLVRDMVQAAQRERAIVYNPLDRLELRIRLYLKGGSVEIHDVDNRLKDLMDALQGRMGGPKKIKPVSPVIKNDRQVWRVIIEKSEIPRKIPGLGGHLTVRRLRKK
jgi:hypothetical protein